MTGADPSLPPDRVPVLTEVVEAERWLPAPLGDTSEAAVSGLPAPTPLPTADELVQRVLGELQHQIDVMLEYRLREVLGPLLARAADNVVRDARSQLASTLRDVVARAVAAELARHRGR